MYILNHILFLSLFYTAHSTECPKATTKDALNSKRFYHLNISRNLFTEFVHKFKRLYNNDEEYEYRLGIFEGNLNLINNLNRMSQLGVFGITKFMDMSKNESRGTAGCFKYISSKNKGANRKNLNSTSEESLGAIPDKWDWRDHDAVTPALDQYICGGCWGFAINSIVESQYAIKHKKLAKLSVQQVIDCSGWQNGCYGGAADIAVPYLSRVVGGIVPESMYRPYSSNKCKCWADRKKVLARVTGGRILDHIYDEQLLKRHIYKKGPVFAAMVHGDGIHVYSGGIVNKTELRCLDTDSVSHAVVIIGYGEKDGTPYWIIKNSNGEFWGDKGFMYLHRGGNDCKILTYLYEVFVK